MEMASMGLIPFLSVILTTMVIWISPSLETVRIYRSSATTSTEVQSLSLMLEPTMSHTLQELSEWLILTWMDIWMCLWYGSIRLFFRCFLLPPQPFDSSHACLSSLLLASHTPLLHPAPASLDLTTLTSGLVGMRTPRPVPPTSPRLNIVPSLETLMEEPIGLILR